MFCGGRLSTSRACLASGGNILRTTSVMFILAFVVVEVVNAVNRPINVVRVFASSLGGMSTRVARYTSFVWSNSS